jgi:transposase
MLHLASNQRYILFEGDADMRKGFDSLSGIVTSLMQRHVLSGDVFIFLNRRRNHIKLLHWEGDGFGLYHKRLERGTYERPSVPTDSIAHQQILLMLQGISLKSVRTRKRYQHQAMMM